MEYPQTEVKQCSECKKFLLIADFELMNNRIVNKIYYRRVCKKCRNSVRTPKYKRLKRVGEYKPNKIQIIETKKNLYNFNKSKNIKVNYSFITPEWYETVLRHQNMMCAICKIHYDDSKVRFNIDHCHITGEVRGLLCRNCNQGIGFLKEKIEILKNSIEYLSKDHTIIKELS